MMSSAPAAEFHNCESEGIMLQVRAAPQAEDCMQYCGGLLRVLTSVKLDVSLAVEPPELCSSMRKRHQAAEPRDRPCR